LPDILLTVLEIYLCRLNEIAINMKICGLFLYKVLYTVLSDAS
jgi:hypothetical protein